MRKQKKVGQLRAALEPLSGRNLKYCTDSCLRRYLEARNWNIDKAKVMIEATLIWRATFKPEEIRWSEVAHKGKTGKVSRANFKDKFGRTVLILRPGVQNTAWTEDGIRHLVYLIENSILNLSEGQEQMSWLIDFTGWTFGGNLPIKIAREATKILQNHYPQRLAVAFIYNPPRFFEGIWKAVKFLLDTKTSQKVKFVYPDNQHSLELMKSFFDENNLPCEFGGKATLGYDYEEFSRLMIQDDIKTVKFWGIDEKRSPTNSDHLGSELKDKMLQS
ncbi:hypothetical protein K2173_006180 [Erythroxylum novogranatense]|uniref:CRAL-TRIO domain-containing protein n=1 Tax=Erythroxylum novogranatense TaxID=1862640 RepID=A0AAV8TCH4_9ROSI|nr:hypothetical protein K2173_006180 [Erythroxylum novogranatense]